MKLKFKPTVLFNYHCKYLQKFHL